jgi:ketosteroid isomerase-like protein
MKVSRRTLATVIALSSIISWSVSGWSDDEDGLAQAIEAFRKAMLAKDKNQFDALCAEELTYGHSSGKVEDKAKFILGAISPNWHWNTLEFVEVTDKVSGDIGIARAVLSGVYENAEGKSVPIRDGVLMIWRKQGSDWRLIARQAFKI